jgi:DNA-binding response OmpR family regulator
MNILVVEDDPNLNKNIHDALVDDNYTVDIAFDGLLAEKMLKRNDYHCVVLDINLPYKNGYELCTSFRQHNITTPVLFLTAFDELEDKVAGFDSGADDYLTKPFYMKELLLRVKSLIKRAGNPHEIVNENITIEDLIINQKTKKVTRNSIEISLTPREYQILLKLAAAQGNLVTKQELIREIWGKSFDANTNTIEVFINFLRNKIDKPFATKLIKTKIGYGYYLEYKQ